MRSRVETGAVYEIRSRPDGGAVVSGGELEGALSYEPPDAVEMASRLVGFLSQKFGSEQRVFDSSGKLVSTRTREPMMPLKDGSLAKALETEMIH